MVWYGVGSATSLSEVLAHKNLPLLCVLLRCLSGLYLAASLVPACEAFEYFSPCLGLLCYS